ncbi:MAG: nucleoside deaminase [bacterium]|nr:nucleoside deaminase [bacterium]MBK8127362.1 nucleoside deaminase [bacterium]
MNSILESFGKPDHERWMGAALAEAKLAADKDEVPIGCVIVHHGIVIGRGHNLTESLQDPTAHAEMIAITAAAEALGSRRLLDCTLYVTLEPCAMCAGAIVLARIPYVVYGTSDPKTGACDTLYSLLSDPRLNHRAHLVRNVRQHECADLLSSFFSKKRDEKKLGYPES